LWLIPTPVGLSSVIEMVLWLNEEGRFVVEFHSKIREHSEMIFFCFFVFEEVKIYNVCDVVTKFFEELYFFVHALVMNH